MAEKNAPAAEVKGEKEAKKVVAVGLSPAQYAAMEDYRWKHRINTKAEVLALALDKLIAGDAASE